MKSVSGDFSWIGKSEIIHRRLAKKVGLQTCDAFGGGKTTYPVFDYIDYDISTHCNRTPCVSIYGMCGLSSGCLDAPTYPLLRGDCEREDAVTKKTIIMCPICGRYVIADTFDEALKIWEEDKV